MITGDHKITATAIAKQLGILENEEEAITGLELEKMSDEDLEKNVRKMKEKCWVFLRGIIYNRSINRRGRLGD